MPALAPAVPSQSLESREHPNTSLYGCQSLIVIIGTLRGVGGGGRGLYLLE